MRFIALVLVSYIVAANGAPQKIIGGSITTIEEYPYAAALMYSFSGITFFTQQCGGTILNSRSILSAAHCFHLRLSIQWRSRIGSTTSSSGGIVLLTANLNTHPNYNSRTTDNDISILRTSSAIPIGTPTVAAGSIAGSNYNIGDGVEVWAIGWGSITEGGQRSENLRHVQVWTINQETCTERYKEISSITDGMLCSGWLDVGGRDQCQGDSGGPLLHNGVVVGVCSWGNGCANAYYPGVNARVSLYTSWIVENA